MADIVMHHPARGDEAAYSARLPHQPGRAS
jgi:hypothetical protein